VRVVAVDHLAPVVLALSDLRALVPAPPVTTILAGATEDADGEAVVYDIGQALPGVSVEGGLPDRTSYGKVFAVLLTIALCLLAVSVLIALVGVGNTLSLSVLERTRENAVLRAVGLSRGRLRAMLAAESLLMATVAAGLGIALGIVYGWAGAAALMGSETDQIEYAVPTGQLATIALVATIAGLLASTLPAHRAARVTPAAAQSDE